MRILILIVALSVSGLKAVAQTPDWVGIWAAEQEWCQWADRVGSHNPAPIEITKTQVNGLENFCEITSVIDTGMYNAWTLALACSAEGETYDEVTMVMVDRTDTLWRWFGVGEPVRFTRCKE